VKTDKVRPVINEVITKVAEKLDLPVIGPMLEVLEAEWDLYKTLQNPNAPEWSRINEWKREHPKLTQALEKLVNKPLSEQTKYQVAKSIKQFGTTRGGGAARPRRDGKAKQTPAAKPVRSTRTTAIQGGKIMATKPIEDKNSKEEWKKRKRKTGLNHPEWYIGKYAPTLVNLNYGTKKTGKCFQNGLTSPTNMPNVLTFLTSMTYPTDAIDSFKQAVATLYTKLRAVNTGTTVYSVNDLTAYIMNVRAFRGLVAMIHRAVQTAQMIDIYDSQVPITLLRGQMNTNGSGAATINNLAALRALGAQLDQQSRSMLPLNLPIIDRTEWIYGNVFADSDDAKAQFYQFTTRSITLFQIDSSNTYTRIFVDIDSVPDILTVVAPLLTTYLSTYISNVIAGDMIKAFGQSAIRPLISDWYAFTPLKPVYDLDILQQIENANVLDWSVLASSCIFRPDFSGTAWSNDFLQTHPITWVNSVSIFDEAPGVGPFASLSNQTVYVNSYKDAITPGDTLSSTRLKFAIDGFTMSDQAHPTYITSAALTICGSEIIERMIAPTSDTSSVPIPTYYTYGVSDTAFYYAPLLSHFDWHPMQFLLNNNYTCEAVSWDFKNFAHVSFRDIEQLHQYANYAIAEPRYDFAEQGRWAAANL